MTGLRDERAAVLRRWHRDMGDNFTAVLPRVLDDLDATDRAHVPGPIKIAETLTDEEAAAFAKRWNEATGPHAPTDAEIAEWVARNPKALEALMAKSVRTAGGDVQRALGAAGTGSIPPPGPVPPVPVSDKPPKAPPAARTAARRRTGGTHA